MDLIDRHIVIDAIEKMQSLDDTTEQVVGVLQAVKSIIKGLPFVQPEPCEDCVSREDVCKLLCRETCTPGILCPDGVCYEIRDKVDALPSVTPKSAQVSASQREDCVSRQVAIDAIERSGLTDDCQDTAIRLVEVLPSVTPKQRHGHWHHLRGNKGHCSVCGDLCYIGAYCATCGAKMDDALTDMSISVLPTVDVFEDDLK